MIVDAAPPDYGGAGAQALLLADELAERCNVDARIVSRRRSRSHKGRHGRVRILGPFTANESLSSAIFAVLCGFYTLFSRADVIHVHGAFYYGLTAALVARLRRRPVVIKITLLGKDDPAAVRAWKKWRFPIGRFVGIQYDIANCVIALNSECRDAAIQVVEPAKVRQIVNGIEHVRGIRDRAEDTAPRIIFVGEFCIRKGADTLLHAWRRVSDQLPGARLEIFGPVATEVEHLRANAPHGVTFHGLVSKDALRRELQEANLFVLPSRAEGLPNAAIEAMSFGLPVVLSDIPVNLSTALDAGSYFQVGSPDDLARALTDAWISRERLAVLVKRRSEDFSIGEVADKYKRIYSELGGIRR